MRFPRPCRLRWLSACSLTVARQGSIGETSSRDLTHRQMEAVSIVNRVVFRSASVEAKHLLPDIAVKVERFNGNIGSAKSSLQQCPEVLNSLSVDFTANVLFHVIHGLVDVLFSGQAIVASPIVRVDSGSAFNLIENFILQCLALDG